jgi:hypothetical protein
MLISNNECVYVCVRIKEGYCNVQVVIVCVWQRKQIWGKAVSYRLNDLLLAVCRKSPFGGIGPSSGVIYARGIDEQSSGTNRM